MPKALPVRDVSAPVCCAPLSAGVMSDDDALEVALRLKALADPVRLQLLTLIASAESGEACNCEMASAVGLTDATVSHHLKALREAGLIVGERRGTWMYYRSVPAALGALCRVLDPACC
jgi:ArsR family transcriptional regulator, arsenate/arsenite/antimonite-responsive transcriptional repressor